MIDVPIALQSSTRLLGTRVSVQSFERTQEVLAGLVERRRGGYVSCANAFSIAMAHHDPHYRALLNAASIVTSDGMSVVWALRALGEPAERVHNDDLLLACCRRYPSWKHFLLGGRTGQPERAAGELGQRFPGIHVVGTYATPQRPLSAGETETILGAIERSGADLVWVAMGTPFQDLWMASVAGRASAPMIGCGSVCDLLAGYTRPTPEWMKRSGLQWLFRLVQEPRRLAYRYASYNTRFVLAFAAQWVRRAWVSPARHSGRK